MVWLAAWPSSGCHSSTTSTLHLSTHLQQPEGARVWLGFRWCDGGIRACKSIHPHAKCWWFWPSIAWNSTASGRKRSGSSSSPQSESMHESKQNWTGMLSSVQSRELTRRVRHSFPFAGQNVWWITICGHWRFSGSWLTAAEWHFYVPSRFRWRWQSRQFMVKMIFPMHPYAASISNHLAISFSCMTSWWSHIILNNVYLKYFFGFNQKATWHLALLSLVHSSLFTLVSNVSLFARGVSSDKSPSKILQEPAGTACCCCIQNILHKASEQEWAVSDNGFPKDEWIEEGKPVWA